MSLVAGIEFVGTIGIALYGLRTGRNLLALALTVLGVFILIDVTWSSDPLGLSWAFLNAALFAGYIILGHRISERGASGGVGICSSVIPYVSDQLAMSRLPWASFALMLALLPATATIIGIIVLAQIPSFTDVIGVLLVMAGVAVRRPAAAAVAEAVAPAA